MATIVRTTLICDKDDCGAEAPFHHAFVVAGKEHELDLCPSHQEQMSQAVTPWLTAAVITSRSRKRRRPSRA